MSRNSNQPSKADEPIADYSRRPYMVGKSEGDLSFSEYLRGGRAGGTYSAMMARDVYSVMERARLRYLEHSQFKKPYWGDEFPEMENFADLMRYAPNDDWNLAFAGDGLDYSSDVCQIDADYMGFTQKDCSDEVVIRFSDSSVDDPERAIYVEESTVPVTREADETGYISKFGESSTVIFRLKPSANIAWSVTFRQPMWVNQPVDPNLWPCRLTVESSSDCSVGCLVSWDDVNSDETIIRNGTAALAIIDPNSGGPYSWSVSGTGFTLNHATTEGLTNTLNADGSACGSATITVTCSGFSAFGYVRCTTGTWVDATPAILCFTGQGSTTYRSSEIVGNLRYDTYWHCTEDSEDPIPPYDSCGSIGDCAGEPFAIRTAAVIRIKEWVC